MTGDTCKDNLSAVKVAMVISDNIQEAAGRRLSVASVKGVLHNTSLYQYIKKFIKGHKSDGQKNKYVLTDDIPSNILFLGVRDSV